MNDEIETSFDELEELEAGDEITDGDTVLTITDVTDVSEGCLVTDHELTYDNGVTQDLESLHSAINKHGSVWVKED